MEGNRKLLLRKPMSPVKRADGTLEKRWSLPIAVYGIRRDRGGGEEFSADIETGKWTVRYQIRRTPLLEGLDSTWSLTDENGNELNIESVQESAYLDRRHWVILAERRI